MADDGVLGDTFRSNTGSLVLNGKNTYTKPEIIEPIRNHNSSSSTSSSSSASSRGPLKKLKGKKKAASSFFGNNKSSKTSSKSSKTSTKTSTKSSSNTTSIKSTSAATKKVKKPVNGLGFGNVTKAAATSAANSSKSTSISAAPKLSKAELDALTADFEGDEEMDEDIDAMPSNTKNNNNVAVAPALPSSSTSSSSRVVAPGASTEPKVKRYKTVTRTRYEEETVEDEQGYFVTRRKEIQYEEQVEIVEETRKRPSPTLTNNSNKSKKAKKGGKQRGLMGFFKKK